MKPKQILNTHLRYQPFLNERHDLDRVTVKIPPNHKNNPTDKWVSLTLREELKKHSGEMYFWRDDIVLINLTNGHGKDWQVSVEAYDDGMPRGDGWDYLSWEQKQWAVKENALMLESAKECPEFAVAYIHRSI